jgi:hypothetical protein
MQTPSEERWMLSFQDGPANAFTVFLELDDGSEDEGEVDRGLDVLKGMRYAFNGLVCD